VTSDLGWGGYFPLQFDMLLSLSGLLEGSPGQATENGPFELEITVYDGHGGVGAQKYLLEVVAPDGGN